MFSCKNFITVKLLKNEFESHIKDDDIVFIKGSNRTGLYNFCKYLRENYELGG